MLVPLVRRLQDCFPQARLTWVISRPAYDLVEGMDGVEFIVIDKPKDLKDYWRFYRKMQHRQFDVLLATQACLRANLLYPCIRATRKIGYDRHRAKDGHGWVVKERIAAGHDHTLEGFLKFADVLGLEGSKLRWDMPLVASDYEWARAQMPAGEGPLVILNPAASKPERSWLVERYISVIQYLNEQWQARVVLTGGPGAYDRELADNIKKAVQVTDLVGKTKPKQLLAVIAQADLVLCPDTGPSHMAAAMGTPVIALHAVTSPKVSGPYPFRSLAVDCYPQAIENISKKKGNTAAWGTQVHGFEAMKLVRVDAVIKQLESVRASLHNMNK